ncbi:MAG: hypothetical protein HKO82_11040 [Acidimicrobiia bacterium]|nr:hypothetical protein [Acidimicrobiia bacterium]
MKRNVTVALFAFLFVLGTAAIAIAAGGSASHADGEHGQVVDNPTNAVADQVQEHHRFRAEPCAAACHAGYRIQDRAEQHAGAAEPAADHADPIQSQERTREEVRVMSPDACDGPCSPGAETGPAEPSDQAPDETPQGPQSAPGPKGPAPFSEGPNGPTGPQGPAAGPLPEHPCPGNPEPGNPEPGVSEAPGALPGNAEPGNPSTGTGAAGNEAPGGESAGRQGSGNDSPAHDQTRHRDLEGSGAETPPHRG